MRRRYPAYLKILLPGLLILLFLSGPIFSRKPRNFSEAKKAMKRIYAGHYMSFYCGCDYSYQRLHGKQREVMDFSRCGYSPRRSPARGHRLEWEHVVPARAFGFSRECWRKPIPGCKHAGRTCCRKRDPVFRQMESDLVNLQPSIGELNGDRSDFRYGMLEGEDRIYGACDFEVDFKHKVAEPRPAIRGDIARTYFYMEKKYGVGISDKQRKLFEIWDREDPVDDWEMERNRRIIAIQGSGNEFVRE